jgi:ATP-dependent helicase/nuclease subunit A
VKRQAEAAGNTLRIMTVHGAKGLEAPVVILPDTTGLPPVDKGLSWTVDEESGAALPLWTPHRDMRCGAVKGLHDASEAARLEEYRRLLYVALTRARDRVVVCGWQTAKLHDDCWYRLVERGMQRLTVERGSFPAWPGELLRFASPQTAAPETARDAVQESCSPPPDWAGAAPAWRASALPAEPARPRPLAPSRPEGVEFGPVPAVRSPLSQGRSALMSRGLLMHALLQHLPALPAEARAAAAARFVAGGEGAGAAGADALVRQALAVLDDPACAALFGPGSRAEQPVSGVVEGQVVTGQVDRLVVLPDAVLVADYKTSRAPPASAEAVPVMYLRQMAAYRAVLQRIFADRPVRCLLIWTDGPSVMALPDALLDRQLRQLDPRMAADHVVMPASVEFDTSPPPQPSPTRGEAGVAPTPALPHEGGGRS